MKAKLDNLLNLLGYHEMPLGIYYTDKQPENSCGPRGRKPHDCLMKYLRLARKKQIPGWISRTNPSCGGASIYAGYTEPNDYVATFVSHGSEKIKGEYYMPSPEAMWNTFKKMDRPKASADYCVFKPLDQFSENEEPEIVVFFARGEVLSGLCGLAFYTFADPHAVAFPFGSGCSSIIAWPRHYAELDQDQAVAGATDPSCRPYLETDELTFAVPIKSFKKMLDAASDSFLSKETWQKVKSKVGISNSRWQR